VERVVTGGGQNGENRGFLQRGLRASRRETTVGARTIGCDHFIAAHRRKVDGMTRVASVHGMAEARPSRQEHASA
jgi:hypothetical protein